MTAAADRWLREPLFKPDPTRAEARAKVCFAQAAKAKLPEALDMLRVVACMEPRTRDFKKKFRDAMRKADSTVGESANDHELRSLAAVTLMSIVSRNDGVGRIIGAVATSLSFSGKPIPAEVLHALESNASGQSASDEPDFPEPTAEFAAAKDQYVTPKPTNDVNATAPPYIEALEAREKGLAKALKSTLELLEHERRLSSTVAWAYLGEDSTGTPYRSSPKAKAILDVSRDLAIIAGMSLHIDDVTVFQSLALGPHAVGNTKLSEVRAAVDEHLKSELASILPGNAYADLARTTVEILARGGEDRDLGALSLASALYVERMLLEEGRTTGEE